MIRRALWYAMWFTALAAVAVLCVVVVRSVVISW